MLLLLESIEPDVIINLAAQAGVRHSLRKPHDYVRNNITSFLNILEYVKNGNQEYKSCLCLNKLCLRCE